MARNDCWHVTEMDTLHDIVWFFPLAGETAPPPPILAQPQPTPEERSAMSLGGTGAYVIESVCSRK